MRLVIGSVIDAYVAVLSSGYEFFSNKTLCHRDNNGYKLAVPKVRPA